MLITSLSEVWKADQPNVTQETFKKHTLDDQNNSKQVCKKAKRNQVFPLSFPVNNVVFRLFFLQIKTKILQILRKEEGSINDLYLPCKLLMQRFETKKIHIIVCCLTSNS